MPPKKDRADVIKRATRGFTLIDVMVAVVIAGILAAIAYPSYQHAIRKARRAEARAALMQTMQQEERYYSHATTYIAFTSGSTEPEEQKFKWFSGESAAASAYEIMATACDNDTIQNCVLLSAKPGAGKVNTNYADPGCGDLMITSTGEKKVSGMAADCWR